MYVILLNSYIKEPEFSMADKIYAEVVTFVAGSLEAGGLPEYTEVLISLIKVVKS